MASIFGAIGNIRKYGFGNAIRGAINTPGGLLGPRTTPRKPGVLYGDSNYYNPSGTMAGNTVSNYVAGVRTPPLTPSGGQLYLSGAQTQGALRDVGDEDPPPGGGGEGGGTVWEPRYFQGVLYTDEGSYNAAKAAAEDAYYQNQLTGTATNYSTGIGGYDQNQGNLGQQRTGVGSDFTNNLNSLLGARDEALQSQQGYFSSIAPDAYQSQQGTYANKTRDEFTRGEGDLTRQRDEAYGSIDQALGDLGQSRNIYDANYQGVLGELEANRGNLLDEEGNPLYDFVNRIGTENPIFSANFQSPQAQGALQNLAANILAPGQNTNEGRRASFKNLKLSPAQVDSLLAFLYPGG